MMYVMPKLPYAINALEPIISRRTITFHYGKHLQTYVDNLNKLTLGTEFEGHQVTDIVRNAPEGDILNNAGQVLNHTLYFQQFTFQPIQKQPAGRLGETIARDFGDFTQMKQKLTQAANSLFGSGWAWLSADPDGGLHISQEINGNNPLRKGHTPLLGIDVWEHAYYLDYQNKRMNHILLLWEIIDWSAIESRLM